MSDPPGASATLGIEAVELAWEPEGNATVRVTGRWRRRRPEWRGQALLVVEAQGRRHRFPAMPEPPSLTGALPGTWRMSFSVPADVAPHLGGRTWLQLGAALVPLPVATPSQAPTPGAPPGPELLAARQLRSYELAAQSARRREAEAKAEAATLRSRVANLTQQLEEARREPQRIATLLAQHERQRRAAEQRAHAEHALREEMEEQLAAKEREAESSESEHETVVMLEERVRELESELKMLRRVADEAEHSAAAAEAGRARAERRLAALSGTAASAPRERAGLASGGVEGAAAGRAEGATGAPWGRERLGRTLRAELQGARSSASLPPAERAETRSPTAPPHSSSLRAELEMIAAKTRAARETVSENESRESMGSLQSTITALRRELEGRASAEARVRGMLADVQSRLDARTASDPQLYSTLAELRKELDRLNEVVVRETAQRKAAEDHAARLERDLVEHGDAQQRVAVLERELVEQRQRSARVYAAIQELRGELEQLRVARPDNPGTGELAGGVYAGTGGSAGIADAAVRGDVVSGSGGVVEPERLSEALARLREAMPSTVEQPTGETTSRPEASETAVADEPVGPAGPPVVRAASGSGTTGQVTSSASGQVTRPWLQGVLRSLLARDPAAAGRLLLAVLPAQHVADRRPVSYDLVLEDGTSVRVTSAAGSTRVERTKEPRSLADVNFRVSGDPASIVRLVLAGRFRRLLGRGLARVEGETATFEALGRIAHAPLSLRQLQAADATLDPALAFTVVSLLVESGWTAGERFTIAHQSDGSSLPGASLQVRDGTPLAVLSSPEPGLADTTIVCPPELLLGVLSGDPSAGSAVRGNERPLLLVQQWLVRAQSG